MKKKLLIIEDEVSLGKQLKWGLSDTYQVATASDAVQARRLLASGVFPVITLDLGLPPSPDTPQEGFRLLQEMPMLAPFSKVIVITGNVERDNAIKAVGHGAVDFCNKPVDLTLLKIILERTYSIYELEDANRFLRQSGKGSYDMCGMLGISPAMEDLFKRIRQVSATHYPVLIRGESGTGKELAARAIHSLSSRAKAPLIIINCGAIPENLMESELFGHEKGSFTGASSRKIGRVEQADNGSVFLDEIGDLPLPLQVKLLRFIQEGTIERIGGAQTIKLDARIIAATNVNLEEAIKEGRFREDLFYRLNVISIPMPRLTERQEDIVFLANHFIREESQKLKKSKAVLSKGAVASLIAHSWPGNIRELRNCICRSMTTTSDGVIRPGDLGLPEIKESDIQEYACEQKIMTIKEVRDAAERHAIQSALAATGNNISQAAKRLGVTRPTLHDLLKKHGLDKLATSKE